MAETMAGVPPMIRHWAPSGLHVSAISMMTVIISGWSATKWGGIPSMGRVHSEEETALLMFPLAHTTSADRKCANGI